MKVRLTNLIKLINSFSLVDQYLIKGLAIANKRNILLGLIYPLFCGLYFSLSRYIRMGTTIDLYQYFYTLISYGLDCLILFIFIIPYTYLWLAIFLFIIRSIRITLWHYTSTLLYSIHIPLLQYYDYFRLCELIYKGHFVYFDVISGSSGATTYDLKNSGILRRIISYMFYRPYILHLIFLSSILIELFFTHGKLHYGVYTLFLYPFVLGIFHCFHQFGFSDFYRDVCLSDYIVWNFTNPRCYRKFWFYLPRAEYYFGFEYIYPPKLLDIIRKTCALEEIAYARFVKLSRPLPNRVWGLRRTLDLVALKNKQANYARVSITGLPRKWSIRIAAYYWKYNGIRWFHTSTILHYPISERLHPLTIHFIKNNPYAILSLVNHPSQNFALIQKVSKNVQWPKPNELYKDTSNIVINNENKTLTDVLEVNLAMRFESLAKNGVILGTYKSMRERFGYINLETMQMRPDFVSYWLNSVYEYKGYLGIDQKNKNVTNLGRNQVTTNSSDSYTNIIDKFKKGLEAKYGL